MNKIYLVQTYPFEDWVTLNHFDNEADANALCDELKAKHSQHNFRVHTIADTPFNRNWFGVK
jgi:hypothetical protein